MTIGERMIEFEKLIADKGFITTSDMKDVVSDEVITLVESNYDVKASFMEVLDGVHIMVFSKNGEYVTDKEWKCMIGDNYVV